MSETIDREKLVQKLSLVLPILALILGGIIVWYAQSHAIKEVIDAKDPWIERLLEQRKRMIDSNTNRIIRLENLHLHNEPHTKVFKQPRSRWL